MAIAPKDKTNSKASKPVFKTARPYADSIWPTNNPEIQRRITEALVELLAPIGEHRSRIPLSKGRLDKKRKRRYTASNTKQKADADTDPSQDDPPLIQQYVTIGYNTTIRAMTAQISTTSSGEGLLGAVFLTQNPQSIQYAHLPVLAGQAKPPIPLMALPLNNDAKLCKALGVARVGIVGVRTTAPGAAALLTIIQEIQTNESVYLSQLRSGQWLGVKVETSDKDG